MTVGAETDKCKKIGLLGGTFDPVHNGHLAVADHVMQGQGLDSVLFVPASLPPHKTAHEDGSKISDFIHRFAMLKGAIRQNPSFAVTDIEARRNAPSYSIDTINILLQQLGKQVVLYFIIGADAFLEIDTWKRYQELPGLVSFVIISRPGSPPEEVETMIRSNFAGYKFDPLQETWYSPYRTGSLILQHMEPVPISSTQVRAMVGRDEDIAALVPPSVEDYIRKQGLYRK